MPLMISDEALREAGLTAREAQIELACRLFDVGKLALWPAAQLAGMGRAEFEGELHERKIPAYRPTLEDLARDLETIDHLQKGRK